MKTKNRIKRNDYNRVLITETLPFETPVIFSNDGLYNKVASFESADDIQKTLISSLVWGEGLSKSINSTNPYLYKVRKNSKEFRRLALLHPMSQWQLKCFYQKYENLILHYCSQSVASIWAPQKIAGSFYSKSSWENINQFKTAAVTLTVIDRYVKHTPSFFSYRGYDRLYKFFISKDYFSLEKKFSVLMTLDVSKCFDSIYTHSLSWAVKDKDFTKSHISVSSTFPQDFDKVIRHGNHNETNGIPIGPESSRIFSEIIFQAIDQRAVAKLEKLIFGVDYTFRRYVDDVFIFADSEDVARLVYEAYADVLVSFNLHANLAKSSILKRPFLTRKSKLIFEAGHETNEFLEKFLEDSGFGVIKPKRIFSQWKLTKSYIESIKVLCFSSSVDYDEVSPFLIAVIAERIKKLVNTDSLENDPEVDGFYLSAIEVLVDVLFFLYSVAPSVASSYKLSTSLILIIRFGNKYLPEHSEKISHRLCSLTTNLLLDQCGKPHAESVDGFVNLEYLNVALSIRELGGNYLLPPEIFNDLFIGKRRLSYFTIISWLFYIRDDVRYKSIRRRLIRLACAKLGKLSDIFMNGENAYLLLDLLSCPFIQDSYKKKWISSLYSVLQKTLPSATTVGEFLASATTGHWQIDWADVDLLNSLEKKELKQAY